MDADADDLFTLPPEEFVAARDRLVARLRGQGQDERARRVAALRRPTVAAWAVDLAVRADPDGVAELVAVHRDLAKAQRRLLSGVRRPDLAALADRRRAAVDAMVERAADALAERGRDLGPHRADVRATFEAVVADPDGTADARRGTLQRALPAPAGFGTLAGLQAVGARAGGTGDGGSGGRAAGEAEAGAPTDDGAAAQLEEARDLRGRAARSAEEALSSARDLERRAADLQRQAGDAAQEADRRTREAEAARARADHAAAAARRAEEDAEAAAGRARRARAQADEAVAQVEQADELLAQLRELTG